MSMLDDTIIASTIPASAGIGLRFPHHQAVIDQSPAVGWMEVHSENYFGGGQPLRALEAARRSWPISLHGVGLSLGSAEGVDPHHIQRIKSLADRIDAGMISDHLSWSIAAGTYLGDLLPLPMTEEALDVVTANVNRFQDGVARQVLVENPSSYLQYRHSTIPEWEFLGEIVKRTGCAVLLDVNNVYVSSCNHGWDPMAYLKAVPALAVREIHLAGHSVRGMIRVDDHASPVCDDVWSLYRSALEFIGPVPTLIEWDNDLPPLERLVEEAQKAQSILQEVCHADAA
jgi:hypothetical protein